MGSSLANSMNAQRSPKKRPKHPNKDIESVIRDAEEEGWEFSKGKKYFRAACPCGGHLKWIHLTPSGSRYVTNLVAWFERQPCWKEAADD